MKKKRIFNGFLAACISLNILPISAIPVSASGNWQEESADIRQIISIQNDTESTFEQAPVLLHLDSTQITSETSIRFYEEGGTKELPFEIESWNPNGTSTVWVKVPTLEANAETKIVGYYNGDETTTKSTDVWGDTYQLVEHFANSDFETDSTGKAGGALTGELTFEQSKLGITALFTGNQKVTYGPLLSGNTFTISTVIDMEDDTPGSYVGLAARDKTGGTVKGDTYFLGISQNRKNVEGRISSKDGSKLHTISTGLTTGNHILTLTYDGSTLKLYMDGKLKTSSNVEGEILADSTTPLTLGAYSDNELKNTYKGFYDEIQMSDTATSDDWESFRYSNYFGDAVETYPVENRNGGIVLTLYATNEEDKAETGEIEFNGYVSKNANISYSLNGQPEVSCGTVEAGTYKLSIPVYKVGTQTLTVTAVNATDSNDAKTVSINFDTVDTIAPVVSDIKDDSKNGVLNTTGTVLSATVDQNENESASVQFYSMEAIALTEENTVLREGTTSSMLPISIAPDSGTISNNIYTKTIGNDKTPYQIYQVSLTEEQQKANVFQFRWTGNAGSDREIGAYVYDYEKSTWKLLKTGSGKQEFSLDLEIQNKGVLQDGKLSILIWRGLNEALSGRESYIAETDQYDFNLMWTTDLQHCSEMYPEITDKQFSWVIDNFDALKTKMLVNTGDLVQVVSVENQWENISEDYKSIEDAGIPYAVLTGNHDVSGSDSSIYNNYFPVSRLKTNPYWGGTNNRDCYYYVFEENGAKFIVIAMGVTYDKSDIEWASNVLKDHSDYFGIIMVHDYLRVDGSIQLTGGVSDVSMLHDELIAKNDNVRLVLCGHNHSANTNLEYFGNRPVYSILMDYQDLAMGGLGYMRMLKFDVENDLIYVNTYSPYENKTAYFTGKQKEKSGLYQKNYDEFVINTDLGGNSVRTLTTNTLEMYADSSIQIGETQTLTGAGTVSVEWKNLNPGEKYIWYAVVTDESGNCTVTGTRTFTLSAAQGNDTPSDKPDKKPDHPETVVNGTAVVNGKTILYKDGKAVTGTKLVTVNNKSYAVVGGYVSVARTMHIVKIGNYNYIADAKGIVVKATSKARYRVVKIAKKSYIVSTRGIVQKSKNGKIVKVGKRTYAVNKYGVIQKATKKYKLVTVAKKKYIVNKNGYVQFKKKKITVGRSVYKTNSKGIATKIYK